MPETATQQTVETTIVEAISKLGPEPEDVTRDATFESLDIDSLDLVEVAQVVEEEFGVVLKGEDMEKLNTVGDAIDLVVARAS
ncbi:MAG TPA: phosphopantetheine-binding protein [Thermoleophilaceae bacterium]|nr:phosphopantetheine-binding protein [Thermoleophilaceae bacterium]